MKLEAFEYFVEVANLGSVSAAAKRCYISQSAMSQQMDALEDALGVQLLNRGKTGTVLTEAGKALLPEAKLLLERYRAMSEILGPYRKRQDDMTIVYTGPLEQSLLLQAVPVFQRKYPDVKVSIRQQSMAQVGELLAQNQCDIALIIPNEIVLKGMLHECIMERSVQVAVSEHHPLAAQKSVRMAQLLGDPVVLLKQEASRHAALEIAEWLQTMGWDPENILHTDTIETQLLMVNLNQGISFMPFGYYPPGIRLIPLADCDQIVHRTEAVMKRKTPEIGTMIRLLKEAAQ